MNTLKEIQCTQWKITLQVTSQSLSEMGCCIGNTWARVSPKIEREYTPNHFNKVIFSFTIGTLFLPEWKVAENVVIRGATQFHYLISKGFPLVLPLSNTTIKPHDMTKTHMQNNDWDLSGCMFDSFNQRFTQGRT